MMGHWDLPELDISTWISLPLLIVAHAASSGAANELEYYDTRGTFRLWDKDFNLLATWQQGEKIPLNLTKDWDGMRASGSVDKIRVVSHE